jgi:superfamily I DNA/RNA helicase
VDLVVNYRCPAVVIDRAVRLIEHNTERFAKTIRSRPDAPGPVVLAADASDEVVRARRVLGSWAARNGSNAFLTRTNRELLPAIAAALDAVVAFRPPPVELLVRSPHVDACLAAAETTTDPGQPLLARLEAVRAAWAAEPVDPAADPDDRPRAVIAAAVLAWAAGCPDLAALREAIDARRRALAELCRDDADLTFATAHATKGLEFDHVIVIGMEIGRFPSARAVRQSDDPARAYEEERRLGYVAWTRARRSLTLLYDPTVPSPFLLEAFSPDELGLSPAPG